MRPPQIPHTLVVYGYGAGADPAKCGGFGYGEGPLRLVGQKALPVLTGAGVPSPQWVHDSPKVLLGGLPESLDICSFAGGVSKDGKIAPATGRAEINDWLERVVHLLLLLLLLLRRLLRRLLLLLLLQNI